MGSDHRGHVPLGHLSGQKALYRLPGHRVQSVKGLVAQKIICPRTNAADHRHLLFHAFGKGVDLPLHLKFEALHQSLEPAFVKARIDAGVKIPQLPRGGVGIKVLFVGNIEDPTLHLGVFVDLHAIGHQTAAVRPENTCDHTQKGGFSGAVGADQPKNAAFPDLGRHGVHRQDIAETLGYIGGRYHALFPPSSFSSRLCSQFSIRSRPTPRAKA